LRKKLKSIENFSPEEILELLQIQSDSLLQEGFINEKPGYEKIAEIFKFKYLSSFYKEFFSDYLLKNVCKNNPAEY